VPIAEASAFGIMTVDPDDRIVEFHEKPAFATPLPQDPGAALASMGIYVFEADLLQEQLAVDHDDATSSHDFGNDLLPRLIRSHRVYGYRFGGETGRVTPDRYWRDVGTLDAYYDANMDLLSPIPPLDLYQDTWAIRTYHGQHPPARVVPGPDGVHGDVHNSILGSGSVVVGGSVVNSILSARVRVHAGARVESSILFDNVQVGAGASLKRCIVDKNVRIPENMRIGYDSEADGKLFRISPKGIVAVPKTFDASQIGRAACDDRPHASAGAAQNLNV